MNDPTPAPHADGPLVHRLTALLLDGSRLSTRWRSTPPQWSAGDLLEALDRGTVTARSPHGAVDAQQVVAVTADAARDPLRALQATPGTLTLDAEPDVEDAPQEGQGDPPEGHGRTLPPTPGPPSPRDVAERVANSAVPPPTPPAHGSNDWDGSSRPASPRLCGEIRGMAEEVTPQGRPLLRAAALAAQERGITLQQIDRAITHCSHSWPSYNGATGYADNVAEVVMGSDGVVLRVQCSDEPSLRHQDGLMLEGTVDKRRGRSSATSSRAPLPGDPKEFIALAVRHGLREGGGDGKHLKLVHDSAPGKVFTVPRTPSDYRWARNAATQIRAELGIDLRDPLD